MAITTPQSRFKHAGSANGGAAVPVRADWRDPRYQAFSLLRLAFTVAPIAFGLDKFFNVLVDEHLQTGAPGVFAAGDVANAHHPFYRERIRVEHWANALHQGPVAARAMLGEPDAYDRLPYFFSDQYDVGMEYAGFARSWDRVIFRGDPATREFIAFWLTGDRVVAGMNVNVWDVIDPIQRLIGERVAVDDRRLADPDVPLEDLALAGTGSSA
jgi:3-phenylpropionate/trans-cinnamate dioxygenase ferredoxin reductase component